MRDRPSERIRAFVDALPLTEGMRVLEIGCGPGVAARLVAGRIGHGFILAIDRSTKAIALAKAGSAAEIAAGTLAFREASIEAFERLPGEAPFDLAFAMRVGALDGRHPEVEARAVQRLRKALRPGGRVFIDTGDPLHEIGLWTADGTAGEG